MDAKLEPEIVHLYKYNIKPCAGFVSSNSKDCKFPCLIEDDDFNKLGEKLSGTRAHYSYTFILVYG